MSEARTAEHIENLKKVIGNFERTRSTLVERRRGMSDSSMVVVDDRLTVNGRTLEALKRALEIAELELQRIRSGTG